MPAIVVHPGLSGEAMLARSKVGGRYKIITPIDWPKGEHYGKLKLRGYSTDALITDGFEFLLTPNKSETDTYNEVKLFTDFTKQYLSEAAEVRFVLGTSTCTPENLTSMCQGVAMGRTPSYVRTDIQLKAQVSKVNSDEHNRLISLMRGIFRAPIKLSGNIVGVKSVTACSDASRFAVNLIQARAIIKEFTAQPRELDALLRDSSDEVENVDMVVD